MSPDARPQRRRASALVIATTTYDDKGIPSLSAPAHDAEEFAQLLADPEIGNFAVVTIVDAESLDACQRIESFMSKDTSGDELVLLYFTGHGFIDRGLLYLGMTNTRRDLLRSTAIPATFIHNVLRECKAKSQVIILDSCFSGAFARGMAAKGVPEIPFEQFGHGKYIVASSNAVQASYEVIDTDRGIVRSVFTRAVVDGIRSGKADLNRDGWVSLGELCEYVSTTVSQRAPSQTPRWWFLDVDRDLKLVRTPQKFDGAPNLASHESPSSVVVGNDEAPASSTDILSRRQVDIERGQSREQRLVQAAALLDNHCTVAILDEVASLASWQISTSQLIEAGVLSVRDGSVEDLQFCEPELRRQVLAEMPWIREAEIHTWCGRAYAARALRGAPTWVERAAQHLRKGLPFCGPDEAAAAFTRAVDHCLQEGRYQDAAEWGRLALELGDSGRLSAPLEAACILQFGRAAVGAGLWAEARQVFARAANAATRDERWDMFAEAALGYGGVWQSMEQVDPTLDRLIDSALSTLPPGEMRFRGRLLARKAFALAAAADPSSAATASQEALRIAEICQDPETLAQALHAQHTARWAPNSAAERLVIASKIISSAVRKGDSRSAQIGRCDRVIDLLELGRIGDAAATLRAIEQDDAGSPYALHRWWSPIFHGSIALAVGDFDGAEQRMAHALEVGLGLSSSAMEMYGVQICALRFMQGSLAELRSEIELALRQRPDIIGWRAVLAVACALAGESDRAASYLASLDAEGLTSDWYWLATLCMMAEAAVTLDDLPRCRMIYDQLGRAGEACVVVGPGLAVLGPVERWRGLLARSLGMGEEANTLYDVARSVCLRAGAFGWLALVERDLRTHE